MRPYREIILRFGLMMLSIPILDLECQLHFQIGN